MRLHRYLFCLMLSLAALVGCTQRDTPCPKNGWVSDECATVGEFPYGDKVIYIPNKEPNKYRWFGALTYDPQYKLTVSPNLAFYWRTGKAADGNAQGWPRPQEDLVRFTLNHSGAPGVAQSLAEHVARLKRDEGLKRESVHGVLPFEVPPSLQLFSMKPPRDDFLFLTDIAGSSTFIRCSPLDEFTKTGVPRCHGTFFPRPGLRVAYAIKPDQVKDWESIQSALTSLISDWETNRANN